MALTAFNVDDVYVWGGRAVVMWTDRSEIIAAGGRPVQHSGEEGTAQLVSRGGRWLIVGWQVSEIPGEGP